uniref:Uncharacterized protein n=1 Tax=Arion vulgaris TaxID=1028688 RepID=A0A0B6ZU33_9EUPU
MKILPPKNYIAAATKQHIMVFSLRKQKGTKQTKSTKTQATVTTTEVFLLSAIKTSTHHLTIQ